MSTENFGFKQLTADNWLVSDKVWANYISGILPDGNVEFMTGNKWILAVLSFDLLETVPIEVRELFAVARGSIAYGYFFYPLLTLATEQLYRVAEAAIDHKGRAMGRHKPGERFTDKIKWLLGKSAIVDKRRWDAIRNLRNEASHPKNQTILAPGMVLEQIEGVAEAINSLFVSR